MKSKVTGIIADKKAIYLYYLTMMLAVNYLNPVGGGGILSGLIYNVVVYI